VIDMPRCTEFGGDTYAALGTKTTVACRNGVYSPCGPVSLALDPLPGGPFPIVSTIEADGDQRVADVLKSNDVGSCLPRVCCFSRSKRSIPVQFGSCNCARPNAWRLSAIDVLICVCIASPGDVLVPSYRLNTLCLNISRLFGNDSLQTIWN
jgi:hypothetical protein